MIRVGPPVSIQSDILDTIGTGGIGVKALRERLGNIGANELDVAINALQRAKRVRIVNERYEVVASTRPLGGMPHTGRPPSAEEEAAASLSPAPVKFHSARRDNGVEVLKVGHQTVNLAGTPPIAGSSPANSTINSRASVDASTAPLIADRVFERVKAQRQEALNKIALLQVELVNQQAIVAERDTFLEMYERFGEGSN
jgi:hypothetical protein